jgi:drug/metabolite transporter (DMT)-like permease
VEWQRSVNGALAGAAAAAVWAAQQPLDKRLFRSEYDDVELLGRLVVRDSSWPLAGVALHI